MRHPRVALPILVASLVMLSGPALARQSDAASNAVRIAAAKNATVGVIAGGAGSTDARVAGDLAEVLNDGDSLRVLPMLGRGSVQNIADLIHLKGVDAAIVHTDVLTETMQQGAIPKEDSLQYIAKLFQEEIHIVARQDITSLKDLNGRVVAIGAIGSGTDLTASTLLGLAHVTPNIVHDSPSVALDRLRRSEIAAMFVVGGKPIPMLQAIEPGTGLHFLSIPLNAQLLDTYLPTSLDHQHYPNLVPDGPAIDSVAVSAVLLVMSAPSDSLRAKRVNRFVDALFDRFDELRQPGFHPKWQEVNLSAQLQGWTRYPEAQKDLVRQEQKPAGADARTAFDAYLHQSGRKVSGINADRREALFQDFLRSRVQR